MHDALITPDPRSSPLGSFCIELTGRFLYSGGQGPSTLFAYRIDRQSEKLKHFATHETGGVPLWAMCGYVEQ